MGAPAVRRITVAVDGSPTAATALEYAADLAKKFSASLTIVAVAPIHTVYAAPSEPWVAPQIFEGESSRYRRVLESAVAQAKSAGVAAVESVLLEGVVVDEILNYLESHPTDLLVLGSRGLSSAKRLLIGSVSEALLHHVSCPVLIVRAPTTAAAPPPPPG